MNIKAFKVQVDRQLSRLILIELAMGTMGNSCRKGNKKTKYMSRRDTFTKIAVSFKPIPQSLYPFGIKMSKTYVTKYIYD